MIITIDKAGRIVLPKPIRDRFNLVAGTALEIEPDVDGLRIRVAGAEPALVRKRGLLVHHGGSKVDLDIAEFINRQREARGLMITAEQQSE